MTTTALAMADDPAFIRDLSTDGWILGLQMGMVIGKYIAHCRAWFQTTNYVRLCIVHWPPKAYL